MKKQLNLKKQQKSAKNNKNKILSFEISALKFDQKDLIPAVVQDIKDDKLLMVAWMNKEAFLKTLKNKNMCYYSRSRQKLWTKGEKSGNFQKVKKVFLDCDNDCLLFKVKQIGNASCHTGYKTCFHREIFFKTKKIKIIEEKVFNPEEIYK